MLGPRIAPARDMAGTTPSVYCRRAPEKTVLYQVVREYYQTFKANIEAHGRSLPAFVEREFEKYIGCGILARGFVRCRCAACGLDRVVAFSCKCRGWCSSCVGRRMADTAAYLVDHVIPNIPMRTWTLTVPYPLRYLMAYNPEVLGEVTNALATSLLGWLRRCAKQELGIDSVKKAHPGMTAWIQRFGAAANLNVHLHVIATEGVFVETESGRLEWHTLPEPSSADVADIAWETCLRVTRALQRRGLDLLGENDDMDELAEREPLLAACYSASIQGFIATGQRAGQRVMQMGVAVADHGDGAPLGSVHGFNLFAGRCIPALDRRKREHAIRYMARPPLPNKRLSLSENGDILLELKRPWANGATHVRFTGPEFIERLVALVPPPRVNLVRHFGVFGPNARLRVPVVVLAQTHSGVNAGTCGHKKKTGRYVDWAQLMTRVFEIDLTLCPRCGTKGIQVIACITQADVIRDILTCIGEPTAPPEFAPARYPDQCELDFDPAA